MKSSENDPLELLEHFAIGVSIIGIIIANGIGQSVYSLVPILFTLFLNSLNRNRLKQQTEKNTRAEVNRLDNLQLEHSNITLAEVYRLEKLQQQSQKNNNTAIAEVGSRIQRIPEMIRRVEDISSQVNYLSDRYSLLREETNRNIKLALHEVGTKIQEIPELIIEIDRVNKRLNNLSSQLDTGSNVRVINEIQSQITFVKSEIKKASNQQELDRIIDKFNVLTSNFNNANELINNLNRRFDNLSDQLDVGFNIRVINEIQSQIVFIKSEIKKMSQQQDLDKTLDELNILTFNPSNSNESSNILQIINDLNSLESRVNNSLLSTQVVFQEIYSKINDLQIESNILQRRLDNQVNVDVSTLRNRLEPIVLLTIQKIINQPVADLQANVNVGNINNEVFRSKLIYNRDKSREILHQALKEAKERIIMICPWITVNGLSDVLKSDIKQALNRNVKIDIGWGMLRDIEEVQKLGFLGKVSDVLQDNSNWSNWYNAVSKLTDLQQSLPNPNLLNLKLIGTHEKFLVCDQSWALITSHNFLTSNDSSREREIGLCTHDENIIAELIRRYENAPDLDKTV